MKDSNKYKNFLLLIAITSVWGVSSVQAQQVVGQVSDQAGEALPGVNIVVQGTDIGTTTDIDGNYELEVPSLEEILVFTFVGFETQEIFIDGRNEINVILQDMAIHGDEVVVIGYGTQRRQDVTGSISSIRPRDFNQGVNLSPQELMQGRAAGVNTISHSGKPGGALTVRIRGNTSITAGNDPLYVIDGVPIDITQRQTNIGGAGGSGYQIFDQEPVNPLNMLNASDIESIDILKDASATAIYGSRGANGVIIITTKRGDAGVVQTSYDTRISASRVSRQLDVLTADEYRQTAADLGVEINDGGANINWQDEIMRTAFSQSHNLAISGGSQATRYRASLAYASNEGILIGSEMSNLNARLNANHNALDDRLQVDLNLTVAEIFHDNANIAGRNTGNEGDMLKDALRFNPTLPKYTEEGSFRHHSIFVHNPLSYPELIDDESTTRRYLGNVSTTYNILDPLSVNVNLGYTYQTTKRNTFVPSIHPIGDGEGGLANSQESDHWSPVIEGTIRFLYDFSENHSIDVIGGHSYQYYRDEGYRAQTTGYITDAIKWYSFGAASNIDILSSFQQSNKLASFYGRINYNLMDRYLLTVTARRDGSSRFGVDNKWGFFPSAAFSWRLNNEPFFPETNVIDDLRLRVSYGVTGNQEIGNLQSISTLSASTSGYVIGGTRRTLVLPSQFPNPNLKWEETAQFNLGVDFELYNNRLYGNVDVYQMNTSDLLLNFAVPSPSAVGSQLANVGEVENRGIEITLGGRLLQQTDLLWTIDANFSANRNKVVALSDDVWSVSDIRTASLSGAAISVDQAQIIKPGLPLGTFYGRVFVGFADDGTEIFEDEEAVIGDANPDFEIGIRNSFFYKNWDLTFNLRGQFGQDVLNNTAAELQSIDNFPGQNILRAGLHDGTTYGTADRMYSSRWLEDGTFVRLDNLTLGYSLTGMTTIPVLQNARLYLTAQNLLIITNYTGYDPEVSSHTTGGASPPRGIDYISYPRSRTVSLGASFTF